MVQPIMDPSIANYDSQSNPNERTLSLSPSKESFEETEKVNEEHTAILNEELAKNLNDILPEDAKSVETSVQVKQGTLGEDVETKEAGTPKISKSGVNEPTEYVYLKDQPTAFTTLPGDISKSIPKQETNIQSIDETSKVAIGWEESLVKAANESITKEMINEVNHYRNQKVIYASVILTWFGTVLGGGIAWCLLVIALCASYYQNSIERYRRAARDEAIRELWISKLENEVETVGWLNNFLDRFWVIYEPGLSSTIKSIVDSALEVSTPAFLDSLSLSEFSLGNKAPRIRHVKTYPRTKKDVVIMDWDFEFEPNNDPTMTLAQINEQRKPRVVLQIRVGKGMVGAGLPVLVENFSFSGNMKVQINFGDSFPHIEVVTLQFIKRPVIDYVLKPVGGDTFGFDVTNIPGLSTFISEQIHATLNPMMYHPNMFSLNVAQMMAPIAKDQFAGVLEVKVRYARELNFIDGSGDPYVLISSSSKRPTYQTTTKDQTNNPDYNETFRIILRKEEKDLKFTVFDYNQFRKDFECGSNYLPLAPLFEKPIQEGVQLNLSRGQLYVGHVMLDLHLYQVEHEFEPNKEAKESVDSNEVENGPSCKSGIMQFTLHQLKELDASKSLAGKFTPYVMISINGKELAKTSKKKRNNNPIYEETVEYVVDNLEQTNVSMVIKDDRGLSVDPIIARWSQQADQLVLNSGWYPLNNVATGKAKVSCKFYPFKDTELLPTKNSLTQPFGLIKLFILEAPKLKFNVSRSDVYIRIKVSGVTKARTKTVKSSSVPRWDQSFEIPIGMPTDAISLEVIETIPSTSETHLIGSVIYQIGDLIFKGEDGYSSKGLLNNWTPIKNRAGRAVGALHFGACVYLTKQPLSSPTPSDVASQSEVNSTKVSGDKDQNKDKAQKELINKSKKSAVELYENLGAGMLSLGIHKVFNLLPGELNVALYLDGNPPRLITETPICKDMEHPRWDHYGNIFIKDTLSQTFMIIIKDKKGNILARKDEPLLELLNKPIKERLRIELSENGGEVELSYSYGCVEYEELTDVNNILGCGKLEVDIIQADNLIGVDSSGTSDPFIKVRLNDIRVYKTQTYKKNLNPKINEKFTLPILDTSSTILRFEVYDWNKVHSSVELGHVEIDLNQPEFSFTSPCIVEQDYPLQGVAKGSLKVRLTYQKMILGDEELNLAVDYLKNNLPHTRTGSIYEQSNLDRTSMVIEAGGNNSVLNEVLLNEEVSTKSQTQVASNSGKPGKIQVTVIGAEKLMAADRGGTSDPYAKIKRGKELLYTTKKVKKTLEPQWNESFTFTVTDSEPCWLNITVMDHNRIQSDVTLGDQNFNIWDHLGSNPEPASRVEFWTEPLRGGEPGRVKLELTYLEE